MLLASTHICCFETWCQAAAVRLRVYIEMDLDSEGWGSLGGQRSALVVPLMSEEHC